MTISGTGLSRASCRVRTRQESHLGIPARLAALYVFRSFTGEIEQPYSILSFKPLIKSIDLIVH